MQAAQITTFGMTSMILGAACHNVPNESGGYANGRGERGDCGLRPARSGWLVYHGSVSEPGFAVRAEDQPVRDLQGGLADAHAGRVFSAGQVAADRAADE